MQAVAHVLMTEDPSEISLITKAIEPVLVNSVVDTGDIDMLTELESQGIDLNAVDYRSRNALHIACINGDLHMV